MQLGDRTLGRAIRRPPLWAPTAPGHARSAPRPEPLGPRAQPAARSARPSRYRIRRRGRERFLTCVEAPTLRVRVERGLSVTAAAARSAPPGSIFLDGAAQGEPFLDPERAVYNLDHHEGCVRAFTLATCEQAMVLVRKRLDLRRRDWTLYANDADLDTVLAIWVLLNHLRLSEPGSRVGAEIMPLLRLEGSIDALGLELQDLCALPAELLAQTQARMNALRQRELALKARGAWERVDLLEYLAAQLQLLDRMVYAPQELEGLAEIEELARTEIGDGSLAVVCRSSSGIYEVERQLRRYHGERLGLIVLQKDPRTYSLRQVDPSLPTTLRKVYAHLNLLDPASDGSRAANRWGGSEEIGGSPRAAGTGMSPQQIASALHDALRRPAWAERLARFGGAALLAASLLAAAGSWILAPGLAGVAASAVPALTLDPRTAFAATLFALAALCLLLCGRHAPGVYGLRPPCSLDGWRLLPLAAASAAAGGVWLPAPGAGALAAPLGWLQLLVLPAAAEILFRGIVHGRLVSSFPIQSAGGRWFVSAPVLLSGALYAAASVLPPISGLELAAPGLVPLLGAFGFGVAAGMLRERSESMVAALVLHWLCAGGVLLGLALIG